MDTWIWAAGAGAVAVTVTALAAGVIFWQRRKTRQIMDSLNTMLDRAIAGSFAEAVFDESLLSATEAKMAHFLTVCQVSSQSLVAEKDKIKGLIADISHQTKTPIANLLLYSQLLEEHKLPEEGALCVKALSAQAQKLDFLIGALVKASRLETGIIAVTPRQGEVQALIEAALAQIRLKAEEKGIRIEAERAAGRAYYDPKWTAEALYNILDNGVKYSPPQSLICIRTIPYELFYRIDISDEGMGIAETEQSQIFARFYRSPAVSGQEGVGLGLFLTREILAAGGGYIKVSSKPGQGAVFSVFLPTEKTLKSYKTVRSEKE